MELRSHGVAVARTGRPAKRAAALGFPKMHHHTVGVLQGETCSYHPGGPVRS